MNRSYLYSITIYKVVFSICFCISAYLSVFAQHSVPPLERTVSLNIQNLPAKEVLEQIAEQGELQFSYSSNVVDPQKRISVSLQNKTIREALNQIFEGKLKVKNRANYVILAKKAPEEKSKKIIISGYILDSRNQSRIPQASIYEKNSLSSSLSNQYGFFQIKLNTDNSFSVLSFSKKNFQTKTLEIKPEENNFLNISLEPKIEINPLQRLENLSVKPKDSLSGLDSNAIVKFLIPSSQRVHSGNLAENFFRKFQISVLPFMGSNHRLSGNVVNDYSINLLIGYSAGTRKFELGGLANVNRGRTEGWQIGGIANLTGEKVNGVQIGGIVNAVRDSVTGVQLGGIVNVNGMQTNGVQLGGIVNVGGKSVQGIQIGGIVNAVLDSMTGVQVAGIINANGRKTKGVQVGGIINIGGGNLQGSQIAGISNITVGTLYGTQVSGIFNFASKVRYGWQVALINYADSAANLKQIGLINFARKGGYKDIELAGNEMYFTTFTFRSGTPYFYTLFRLGLRPIPERPFWYFGYGFGFARLWRRNWVFTNELVYQQLLRTLRDTGGFNQFFVRWQSDFSKKLGKHWAMTAGTALTMFYLRPGEIDYSEAVKLSPLPIWEDKKNTTRHWLVSAGGQLALRFIF